jgi:hypothetical protein
VLRPVNIYFAFSFLAVCAFAARVHAHEPPHGIRLLWPQPQADATPVVLTNRGLVYPNESGASLYVLRCNEAYNALTSARPAAMVDDQGAIVVATPQDVLRSSDRACTFTPSMGLPTGDVAQTLDLALGAFAQDPTAPKRALITTQVYKSAAQVLESNDYARTWTVLSTNKMYSVYKSLKIAEDGVHLLAAGQRYDMAVNKLLSISAYSEDGGKTWTDADVGSDREPLGFLPNDGKVGFMRESIPKRTSDPADHLLRSSDGGKTFETIGGEFPPLSAFAATPDGNTVWIGARFGGLFRSDDAGKTFTRVLPDMVTGADCLYYRQGVLWVCANMAPNTDGIWTSKDLGATFAQELVFNEVTEQVQCADLEICATPWRDWQYELLNGWNSTDGGPAPVLDAGRDAGVASDAASAPPAADFDAGLVTESDASEPAGANSKSSGCALASPRSRAPEGALRDAAGAMTWLALAALLRRRRRARVR